MRGPAILAFAALLVALPAAAQEGAPTQDDAAPTIVVTGKTEAEARKEAYEQARAISRVGRYQLYEEALPRFETAICPAVIGLRDDYSAEIVDRVRANARRLELPVGDTGCSPNLLVAFLADGQSFLTQLERRNSGLFRLISTSERDELLHEPVPVRVWNNIALRWTGAGAPPPGWPKSRPSVRGQLSRSIMPEAKDIQASLVIFDHEAVIGMTLTQLADYATMRGLSNTRPTKGDEVLTTILGLFENGGGSPDELTRFDIGYLRSLYYAEANMPAVSRLLRVGGRAQEAGEP